MGTIVFVYSFLIVMLFLLLGILSNFIMHYQIHVEMTNNGRRECKVGSFNDFVFEFENRNMVKESKNENNKRLRL